MPKAMREKLQLREGDKVEVAVSTPTVEASVEDHPLLALCGIGRAARPMARKTTTSIFMALTRSKIFVDTGD